MRAALLLYPVVLCSAMAACQMVTIGPRDGKITCDSEKVITNLIVSKSARISGSAVDPSSAPFSGQQVQLLQKDRVLLTANTDSDGRFNLGKLKEGEYRLLVGKSRVWLQPVRLECLHRKCDFHVVVGLKPTDSDYFALLGCPVK